MGGEGEGVRMGTLRRLEVMSDHLVWLPIAATAAISNCMSGGGHGEKEGGEAPEKKDGAGEEGGEKEKGAEENEGKTRKLEVVLRMVVKNVVMVSQRQEKVKLRRATRSLVKVKVEKRRLVNLARTQAISAHGVTRL